jgi:hypothetical protein
MSASTSYGHAPASVEDRGVPKTAKVRRSKLPGYSISSSATANLRVAAALLAV